MYVVYYCVSTRQQEASGLGLEAQKSSVERFLIQNKAEEVPPSFTEIESGKRNDRPELLRAINRCKETGSTLLIAKLDRLSRNASFILNLRDELARYGIKFQAVDMPDANTLTIGVMALMAQQEAEFISQRTKAGLQAAKLRGVKLGKPENLTKEHMEKGLQTRQRNARMNENNRKAYHFILPRRESGVSFEKIADELNQEGYSTRKNKRFHATQVRTLYLRFQNQ